MPKSVRTVAAAGVTVLALAACTAPLDDREAARAECYSLVVDGLEEVRGAIAADTSRSDVEDALDRLLSAADECEAI